MGLLKPGQVAIVTGASSGIGLAVAQALAARGLRVALVARGRARLEELAASLGEHAAAFPLDVQDRAALALLPGQVAARFGGLDVLVNNAAVNHRGPVRSRSFAQLADVIETNLIAPILLARAAIDQLRPGGTIVNVASLAGKVPIPYEAAYSASKAGLRAFGRALRLEHPRGDVRVCTICPGPVDTGFIAEVETVSDLVYSQPMRSAAQVAAAIVRAVDRDAEEVDIPRLSGAVTTLGYLFPALFATLRPALERHGANNKKRYVARRTRERAAQKPSVKTSPR